MDVAAGISPLSLGQDGPGVLTVEWSDGHKGRHRVRDLRLACRCAQCVDEWTNQQTLDPSSVPEDVRPVTIEPVGLYGLQIEWSDGHGTGIFTFEVLGSLCCCADCVAQGVDPA
jgi:ATP-binding protein involved in chromosome partitioning